MIKHQKIIILTLIVYFLFFAISYSEVWYYSFGVDTGSFTSGEDTTFLPSPGIGGGTARVRVGNGGGGFYLENPGIIDFGSESELRGVASSGNSYNKFSIYNYLPGNTFTIKFLIRFDGGGSGKWYFFIGNGSCFENNNKFTTKEVFTGLKWKYESDSTISLHYRDSAEWKKLKGVTLNQDVNYVIEIWGNNSYSSRTYSYNGLQNVDPNKFDLWINGELVGDDLPKGGLPDGTSMDSWMFYGGSSDSNVANIYLDDIYYSNFIYTDGSLPVEISDFKAKVLKDKVRLEWKTESEIDNLGFNIYRSKDDSQFELFASYKDHWELLGYGTSSTSNIYIFTDEDIERGSSYWYLLSSVDYSGVERKYLNKIQKVLIPLNDIEVLKDSNFVKIYPNPFNLYFNISINLFEQKMVSISIYNIAGKHIRTLLLKGLSPGNNKLRVNCSDLNSGVYLIRFDFGSRTVMKRVLLIK